MKFYNYFLAIAFFISFLSSAQTKDSLNVVEKLHKKIKGTSKLYQEYEYKKALKVLKECIKEAKSIKNDSLLGKCYILNGIVYSYLNKETEAIKNHRKAEAIFTKIKNFKMVGIVYNNIAFAYYNNSKNRDSTNRYYKKALSIYEYIGDTSKMPLTAANLGESYEKDNQLEKATEYLEKAIHFAKINDRKWVLSFAYSTYAMVAYKKNNLQKSLKLLNLSQEIAEKDDSEQILIGVYQLKSTILEKLGDINNSYIYLKKYDEYLDRTHKIEKSRLIQEAAVKFEVKENKVLVEKTKLENNAKEIKLKKSWQIIFFTAILFLIAVIASLLLYKNNTLKIDNNKLLTLKNEELKELQHQTELNFLKTQIQPNFFFNTLTILHTLILEKSENAKEVIIKLSELMQYSIYESKKESVSIWDEINNIQNYLEIERLYKKQKTAPIIQVDGNIDNIEVPPLLYFSFIENYFKSSNPRDKDIALSISFNNLNDKHLIFNLKNKTNIPKLKEEAINEFGIENIKHRLNLMYKNNYLLITQSVQNTFIISLKTPL